MHHVADDKRARQSAEMLFAGLMACLESASLAQVTVTQVCSRAHVSRATFYRLFDDVADVLAWRCGRLADELLGGFRDSPGAGPRERAIALTEGWMGCWPFVSAMASNGRLDLLLEAHLSRADEICGLLAPGVALGEGERECFATLLAAALAAAFRTWTDRGRVGTAEEVYDEMAACVGALASLVDAPRFADVLEEGL